MDSQLPASTVTATALATATARSDQAGAWTTRYTWRVPEGSGQPEHTSSRHRSETAAIDAAVSILDSQTPETVPRIVRAEISGPGRDRYTVDWRP